MSMLRDLMRLVDADPDALIATEPGVDGYRQTTRSELADLIAAQAGLLREADVGPGDCVGVWLPSWSEAIGWQYAARAVGAHVVGINTRYNVAEVANVLRLARPKVIPLAADFVGLDLIGRLRDALAQAPDASRPIVVPTTAPGRAAVDPSTYDVGAGAVSRPDAVPGGRRALPGESAVDELAVAFTTSGSTGLPKLAAHRDGAVALHARDTAERLGLGGEHVIIGALPYSGTFGYSAMMAGISAGASVLLHPSFDPDVLLDEIAEFKGSHVAFGDDMLGRMRDAWHNRKRDLASLRWVGIADFNGESGRLAAWLRDEFGTATVGVYGSSEVFALTSFWDVGDPTPQRWSGGGSLTNPDVDLRIVDVDGNPVAVGAEGEIQLRGPNVVDEYLGQPEKMSENVTDDGWFTTGDLGRLSGDRTFTYVCRMSDALRLKGFLVEPEEIASRLAEHPSVERAKVVGIRGSRGEEAVGFVTLRDGAADVDGDELIAFCAESLARFKVPARVYVIREMPVTAGTNGTKIKAATLRDWATNGLPQQQS